jgi:FixJ family two-component response regulator
VVVIQNEGWRAETFASTQELLDRPRCALPIFLVLDVSLAGLNGLDLQQQVAPERNDMPMIFITGHGDIPMTVRAHENRCG